MQFILSMEFIEMISYLHDERFNAHLAKLSQNQTPCGIFFDFELIPADAAQKVQVLQNLPLNVTCAIVIADVQVAALQPLVDVPVITLEDFPRFGEENFPVKPQEVFMSEFAYFAPYFERHGIEVLAPSYIESQSTVFAFMMRNLPALYSVYEMFGGDESKKVFCAAIKGRLSGKLRDYRFATEPQYFLEGFTPDAGDIAVDGGAFDGATAVAFAKCGAKVFAFEMDANNFQNCQRRIAEHADLNITLENLGLSDRSSVDHYDALGVGSRRNSNGASTAQFVDLDSYVAQKNLPRVDYIKLDIEGAELDMLHGAAQTIKRFKPKMAVSAYHKIEDLWTLALYIKSLRPDYEFEFRHYKIDGTDYILNDAACAIMKYFDCSWLFKSPCEMVLYCR